MENYLLDIDHLCKSFRLGGLLFGKKIMAVDDVTIRLSGDKPWILSIVGESGSGKTTLARMILGLLEKTSGSVKLDGKDIGKYSKKDFYKLVQPIFQNPFSAFSSLKKVDTYLYETAKNIAGYEEKAKADDRIREVLASVGLDFEGIKGKYPNQFSGGELQRISIARALIPRPKIIIADEPVAMIDASLRMNVVNIFRKLRDELGVSFIYVTHDLSTAYYVSDYISVIYRGNLIEFGEGRKVLDFPMHPYTELLLNSIPRVGQKWEEEIALSNSTVADYTQSACRFASRCPYAKDICCRELPEVYEKNGHRVMCHKYND